MSGLMTKLSHGIQRESVNINLNYYIRRLWNSSLFQFIFKFRLRRRTYNYHLSSSLGSVDGKSSMIHYNPQGLQQDSKQYLKLESSSDDNPSVTICRWRKWYFDKKYLKIPISPLSSTSSKYQNLHLKLERFKIKKIEVEKMVWLFQVEKMGSPVDLL